MYYIEYFYSWVVVGVYIYLIYYYKVLIYIYVILSMYSIFLVL